jgi:hypothetical protein
MSFMLSPRFSGLVGIFLDPSAFPRLEAAHAHSAILVRLITEHSHGITLPARLAERMVFQECFVGDVGVGDVCDHAAPRFEGVWGLIFLERLCG